MDWLFTDGGGASAGDSWAQAQGPYGGYGGAAYPPGPMHLVPTDTMVTTYLTSVIQLDTFFWRE